VAFDLEALCHGNGSETAREPFIDRCLDIGNSVATPAYQVVVGRLGCLEEAELPAGVECANPPLGDEDAEISIDGAEADFGELMSDEGIDLISGEVSTAVFYGLEDRVSLSAVSMDHERSHPTAQESDLSIINNGNNY
jgi:hypothetical protein